MRIGCFQRPSSVSPRAVNPPGNGQRAGKYHESKEVDRSVPSTHGGFAESVMTLLYILYGYLILVGMCICHSMLVSIETKFDIFNDCRLGHPSILPKYNNWDIPCLAQSCTNLLFLCLVSHMIKRVVSWTRMHIAIKDCKKGFSCNHHASPLCCFFSAKSTRSSNIMSVITLSILTVIYLLIGIANPSIKNPGPDYLNIYYQNVQGLIPFKQLGKPNPSLLDAKVYELNTYFAKNKPDVVLLNETWLVSSIHSKQVFHGCAYDVYRCDRSPKSHPSDPDNPKKFKKSAGGVLIAVRTDLEAKTRRISLGGGAEIIAVEVTMEGVKHIFCTCYRVGTLGHGCIFVSKSNV